MLERPQRPHGSLSLGWAGDCHLHPLGSVCGRSLPELRTSKSPENLRLSFYGAGSSCQEPQRIGTGLPLTSCKLRREVKRLRLNRSPCRAPGAIVKVFTLSELERRFLFCPAQYPLSPPCCKCKQRPTWTPSSGTRVLLPPIPADTHCLPDFWLPENGLACVTDLCVSNQCLAPSRGFVNAFE